MAPGVLWILLPLLVWPEPGSASLPLVMDSVIQALAELEQKAPVTADNQRASAWLLSAQDLSSPSPLHRFLLDAGNPEAANLDRHPLSPELKDLMKAVARHYVKGGQEHGVVLAPDGSTVAVEPLLRGLVAGLQARTVASLPFASLMVPRDPEAPSLPFGSVLPGLKGTSPGGASADVEATLPNDKAKPPTIVNSLLAATLATELGLAFLQGPLNQSQPGLGTEGCWDQLSAPQVFTLLDPKALTPTMAFLNGALDGALLGDYLSRAPEPRPALSRLLSQYYGAGVAGDPGFRSNFRRQNGASLVSAPTLTQQVWGTLVLQQLLKPMDLQLQNMSQERLAQVASYVTQEFIEAFLGCPAILPRCRWGAAPYRGRPTPLKLPLEFLYVHHTYLPAQPCTTLARCAADLRSMQRFHQAVKGWDDIGYSFVVGSDGYVYEGRGWHWVGSHTRGHNSRGFGVAFVGNYTDTLPTEAALRAVREGLPRCAARAGLLRPDYKLLGHRQLVRTDCPGDALFSLLRTWPHFAPTKT